MDSSVGSIAQSVGHLTLRYLVWPHTYVSPSADSRGAVVSCWRKYLHEVLVNRLGGLSLPRKSVIRLTDRPDMTLDVYRGRKTTTQQQHNGLIQHITVEESTGKCIGVCPGLQMGTTSIASWLPSWSI